MTREALIKHWDVIQAFKDGKTIEYKPLGTESWKSDHCQNYEFRESYEYRIKPEPTKRLPTIEEVEKWFLENKVFVERCSFNGGINPTLVRITTLKKRSCELFIHNEWYTIEMFYLYFLNIDGSELYITE